MGVCNESRWVVPVGFIKSLDTIFTWANKENNAGELWHCLELVEWF